MILHLLARTAVRVAVLSAAVAAFDTLYGLVVPPPGDADIGRGLLAFALAFSLSGLWGVADGARGRLLPAVAVWVLTSVVGGLAWYVGFAVVQTDATVSVVDNLRDPSFFFFTQWLVALPGVVGVLAGRGLARLSGSGASSPSGRPVGPARGVEGDQPVRVVREAGPQ